MTEAPSSSPQQAGQAQTGQAQTGRAQTGRAQTGRAQIDRPQIDELVALLPDIAGLRAANDQAFRIPWEIRSFALGIAAFTGGHFSWPEFQAALIAKIDEAGPDRPAHEYYARWTEAFESLVLSRVGIDPAELDERTAQVLATPRDATHQHAHHHPVSVDEHSC